MKKTIIIFLSIIIGHFASSQNFADYENDFAQKFPKMAQKFKIVCQNNEYDNSIISCKCDLGNEYLNGYCTKNEKNWYFSIGFTTIKSVYESGEYLNQAIIQKIMADAELKMKEKEGVVSFDGLLCNIAIDESQTSYSISYSKKTDHINYIYYFDANGIFTGEDINDMSGPDD